MKLTNLLMTLTLAAGLALTGCTAGPESHGRFDTPVDRDDPFARGTDRDPSARTLQSMARLLTVQHKDEQARYVLEQTIDRYPTFAPAYSELAELHMRHGRLDHAMVVLEEGHVAVPTDAALLNNLGMCHLLEGDFEQALALFEQASELDGDNARYHANRATALGMLARYEQTLEVYREILPEAEAHYNLAVLYEANRERELAEQHFREAELLGFHPK